MRLFLSFQSSQTTNTTSVECFSVIPVHLLPRPHPPISKLQVRVTSGLHAPSENFGEIALDDTYIDETCREAYPGPGTAVSFVYKYWADRKQKQRVHQSWPPWLWASPGCSPFSCCSASRSRPSLRLASLHPSSPSTSTSRSGATTHRKYSSTRSDQETSAPMEAVNATCTQATRTRWCFAARRRRTSCPTRATAQGCSGSGGIQGYSLNSHYF